MINSLDPEGSVNPRRFIAGDSGAPSSPAQVCRQLGLPGSAWVGLGPAGIGKRTLQVRAEKRLRESAEERSARLVREVAALAGDTAEQQATIESLSRRLEKVRTLISQKEARLASAAQQSTQLQARLKGTGCAQEWDGHERMDMKQLDRKRGGA
eukprot:g30237.t1